MVFPLRGGQIQIHIAVAVKIRPGHGDRRRNRATTRATVKHVDGVLPQTKVPLPWFINVDRVKLLPWLAVCCTRSILPSLLRSTPEPSINEKYPETTLPVVALLALLLVVEEAISVPALFNRKVLESGLRHRRSRNQDTHRLLYQTPQSSHTRAMSPRSPVLRWRKCHRHYS